MPLFYLSHHILLQKERLGLQFSCVLLSSPEFEWGLSRAWKQEGNVVKINTSLVYIFTGNFPWHIKMQTKRSNLRKRCKCWISLNLWKPTFLSFFLSFFYSKKLWRRKLAKCSALYCGCQIFSIWSHCCTDLPPYYRQAGAWNSLLERKASVQMHIISYHRQLQCDSYHETGNVGSWTEDKMGGISLP